MSWPPGTGLFGIAVVITALYPGMTVLLARFVLGERMRLASSRSVCCWPGLGAHPVSTGLTGLSALIRHTVAATRDSCGRKNELLIRSHESREGERRRDSEIVVVVFFLAGEDEPAHLEVKLLGVRQIVHHPQRLLLAGRLQDELTIPEQPSQR